MAVEHVVDAEIVVDCNGNLVSSYSGSNTSCFQFDTERVRNLFNNGTIAYLQDPQGHSNAVYISGIKASMHNGIIITDAIEFEYYERPEIINSITNINIDRPFYPGDFISTTDKWTLYVEEGTFDTDKDEGLFVPYKVLSDINIKPINPETITGIIPATHYEFDPEYFYKLCAFTVMDLRTDPITRYECILVEANPTHLVFAAFDAEKEYSGGQEFKNIKRLTVNMDRYLAGEFQMIRHVWEGK